MIRPLSFLFFWTALFDCTLYGQGAYRVQSEIQVEEAWMGQEVRLAVTLMSPGPFSGTTLFKIPEIPNTLIIKHNNPVGGTKKVNGESMLTLRHEFSVYTQQVGKVEIPAFPVEYESKNTFIGDAVPRSGITTAVRFNSKRPPGTDKLPFVISSATLTTKETWSPSGQTEFEAGEILSRSIIRHATDVSAVFLSPFEAAPVNGVRIYRTEPDVIEKRQRGVATAKRTDTLKYQFERAGTFTIPEITETWWNPKTEKLEQVTLEGLTVSITAPPTPPRPVDKTKVIWMVAAFIAALAAMKRFLYPLLQKQYTAWQERRHSPEAVATRELNRACRNDQPKDAYSAMMSWQRAVGKDTEFSDALRTEIDSLARRLFSEKSAGDEWDGSALLSAFRAEVKSRRPQFQHLTMTRLPQLNPERETH